MKTWDSLQSINLPSSLLERYISYGNKLYSQIFGGNTEEHNLEEVISWKEKYQFQYSRNSEKFKGEIKSRIQPLSNHKPKLEMNPWTGKHTFPFGEKIQKILFFGDGNITTSKKIVYSMIWEEPTPFKMTTLFPGNEGMGSGVGFEINGKIVNISTIRQDKRILDTIHKNPKWKEQIKEIDGLVFVMDANASPEEFSMEFRNISDPSLGIKETVPILILSCRNELCINEIYPYDIARLLNLESCLSRQWCVRRINIKSLDDIFLGLDWLLSVL